VNKFVSLLSLCVVLSWPHDGNAEPTQGKVVAPIRLNKDALGGLDLAAIDWPAKDRIGRTSELFGTDELSVSVFESTPADPRNPQPTMTRVQKPYPWDQFVVVLSGKAILTDSAGTAHSFVAGDSFVVPKGFTGTWQDFGVYRELVVIWGTAAKTRKLELN
jgi:hypothetical protein